MSENKVFVASEEAKSKALTYRIIAFVLWLSAMGGEAFAALKLLHNETLTWLIVAIVAILVLAVVGNLLWKKANSLDPASEKEPVRFFIQNQLGVFMSVLAFLPIVILIFTNKDLDKKTKNIAGAIAVIAMIIAGVTGVDYNPPSIEKYTQQIQEQTKELHEIAPNINAVYWIGGTELMKDATHKYHIYKDCQHIKNKPNIHEGSIKDAFGANGASELCKTCKERAEKEKNIRLKSEQQKDGNASAK
jgi:hypothetical protein